MAGVPQPVPEAAHPTAPGPLPHAEEPGALAGAAQRGVCPQVSHHPGVSMMVTSHLLTSRTGDLEQADKETGDGPHNVY